MEARFVDALPTAPDRFRHGTKLLCWRPDKAPAQCTFEQMEREARLGMLFSTVITK